MTQQQKFTLNPICGTQDPMSTFGPIICTCRPTPGHDGDHSCGVCSRNWPQDTE